MERGLSIVGQSVAAAAHWPHGAILWREANDKKGYETVAPISLELRQYPRAGDVPLFFGGDDPARAIKKEIAYHLLKKGEQFAGIPHLERGGFHPFRRLWASERRHLPAQNIAAAGGWRSLEVMRTAYQQADGQTVFLSSFSLVWTQSGHTVEETQGALTTYSDVMLFRFNV